MKTPCFDTVILSDLHLGSEVSRAHAALRMLKAISFRRLILLGDIFCDLNFRRLKKEHWHFLGYIRRLSNPKRDIEVVWVEGNHDQGLSEVMSHLVGIEVFHEYDERADDCDSGEERSEVASAIAELLSPAGLPADFEYEGVSG